MTRYRKTATNCCCKGGSIKRVLLAHGRLLLEGGCMKVSYVKKKNAAVLLFRFEEFGGKKERKKNTTFSLFAVLTVVKCIMVAVAQATTAPTGMYLSKIVVYFLFRL